MVSTFLLLLTVCAVFVVSGMGAPCDLCTSYSNCHPEDGTVESMNSTQGPRCFTIPNGGDLDMGSYRLEWNLTTIAASNFQVSAGTVPASQNYTNHMLCGSFNLDDGPVNCTENCNQFRERHGTIPNGRKPALQIVCTSAFCDFTNTSFLALCSSPKGQSGGCDVVKKYNDTQLTIAPMSVKCFATRKDDPFAGGSANYTFSITSSSPADAIRVDTGYVDQSQDTSTFDCASFVPTGDPSVPCGGATLCENSQVHEPTPEGKQPAYKLNCTTSQTCMFTQPSELRLCANHGGSQCPPGTDRTQQYDNNAMGTGPQQYSCFATESSVFWNGGSYNASYSLTSNSDMYSLEFGWIDVGHSPSNRTCGTTFETPMTSPLVCDDCSGEYGDGPIPPGKQPAIRMRCDNSGPSCSFQPNSHIHICAKLGMSGNQSAPMGCDRFHEYSDTELYTAGISAKCFATQKDQPFAGGFGNFSFSIDSVTGVDSWTMQFGHLPDTQDTANQDCGSFTFAPNSTLFNCTGGLCQHDEGGFVTPNNKQPAFKLICNSGTECSFTSMSNAKLCATLGGSNSSGTTPCPSCSRQFHGCGTNHTRLPVTQTSKCFPLSDKTAKGIVDYAMAIQASAGNFTVEFGSVVEVQGEFNPTCASFNRSLAHGPINCMVPGCTAALSDIPIPDHRKPAVLVRCLDTSCAFDAGGYLSMCADRCAVCSRDYLFCDRDESFFPITTGQTKCFPLGYPTGGGEVDYTAIINGSTAELMMSIDFGVVPESQGTGNFSCGSFNQTNSSSLPCSGSCGHSKVNAAVPFNWQPAIRVTCTSASCGYTAGDSRLSMCSDRGPPCPGFDYGVQSPPDGNSLSTTPGTPTCYASSQFFFPQSANATYGYALQLQVPTNAATLEFGTLPNSQTQSDRFCGFFNSTGSVVCDPACSGETSKIVPAGEQAAFRITCTTGSNCDFTFMSGIKACINSANPPGGTLMPTQAISANATTFIPTQAPSPNATNSPTVAPTQAPSPNATNSPTVAPTQTPTVLPSASPTVSPTTAPTARPTPRPTVTPGTPTSSPTTGVPTVTPSQTPTATPSSTPTAGPTVTPTASPTASPSATPTASPSATPTASPTASPSATPTASPTAGPTVTPTASPTAGPSATPTAGPTASPTVTPGAPTSSPTTGVPSQIPTTGPTVSPTASPTVSPGGATSSPTIAGPTVSPSGAPSKSPTAAPSAAPGTTTPQATTVAARSLSPSAAPSSAPTATPCLVNCTSLPQCAVGSNPNSVPQCAPAGCVYDCTVPPADSCATASPASSPPGSNCTAGDLPCLLGLPLCGVCQSADSLQCRTLLLPSDAGGCTVEAQSTCYDASTTRLCAVNEAPTVVQGSCCPTCLEANNVTVDAALCAPSCTQGARCEIQAGDSGASCVARVSVSLRFPDRAEYSGHSAAWWTGWFRTVINGYCQGRPECVPLRATIASLVAESPALCNNECTLVLTFQKQQTSSSSRRRQTTSGDAGIFPDALPTDAMVEVIADAAQYSASNSGGATGTTFSLVVDPQVPVGVIAGAAVGAVALGVGLVLLVRFAYVRGKARSTIAATEAIRARRESELEHMRDNLQ